MSYVAPNPVVFVFSAENYLAPALPVFDFSKVTTEIQFEASAQTNYTVHYTQNSITEYGVESNSVNSLNFVTDSTTTEFVFESNSEIRLSLPVIFNSTSGYVADPGDNVIFDTLTSGSAFYIYEPALDVTSTSIQQGSVITLNEDTDISGTAKQLGSRIDVGEDITVTGAAVGLGSYINIVEDVPTVTIEADTISGGVFNYTLPLIKVKYDIIDAESNTLHCQLPEPSVSYLIASSASFACDLPAFRCDYRIGNRNEASIQYDLAQPALDYQIIGTNEINLDVSLEPFDIIYAIDTGSRFDLTLGAIEVDYRIIDSDSVSYTLDAPKLKYELNVASSFDCALPAFEYLASIGDSGNSFDLSFVEWILEYTLAPLDEITYGLSVPSWGVNYKIGKASELMLQLNAFTVAYHLSAISSNALILNYDVPAPDYVLHDDHSNSFTSPFSVSLHYLIEPINTVTYV